MMKITTFFLLFFLSFCLVTTLSGQRFPCNGQILVATNDGVNTTISRPIAIPFALPFLGPEVKYFNGSFDALGFNSKDNYIYGVQENTKSIVRLKSDNSFEVIGSVSIVDTLRSNAGDCTPDGFYLCHDYKLNQILVFDVVATFQLIRRVNLFWDPSSVNSGAFTNRIFDFAFDPNDPTVAYAYQGSSDLSSLSPVTTSGNLLRINLNFADPNLGMVTPIRKIGQNNVTHLGALVFSPRSELFGFGTGSNGFNPLQNILYNINANNGQVSQYLTYIPAAKNSDGCSCPFSFTFSNSVPGDGLYCNNDEKTFVLRIDHNAYVPISNVILRDTFPKGMIITEVSSTFDGKITTGTGVGSNLLEITGLEIPIKTFIEIRIKVKTIDAKIGPTYNQAFLDNLPERYNGQLPSDNLFTIGEADDASLFFVIARELKDVTWKIIPPTDCIDANNGQIIISSKQFFAGQEFEIGLRNKIGYKETSSRLIVDKNNSLIVDSLVPGDYQIFNLRLLSENCALALRDTTILLEAPNNLLKLKLSSNSPVCEGQPLVLNSTIFPITDIWWTGPDRFGSIDLNPVLVDATKEQSGKYKAEVTYGYCTQVEFLDVDIKPTIKATITGKSEYCARDTLKLLAVGIGKDLKYSWTRTNSTVSLDSNLVIANIGRAESGYYEMIATNGACSDTSDIDVLVFPTPTISLEEMLLTDFCAPLILTPEVLEEKDVSYTWTPSLGLSCHDCPNPQILPFVQSSYQLRVENEFLCSDSARVELILDKSKIVFAPNVFQPSSSLGNDHFSIKPGCVTHFILSLDIYDRWGNTVFASGASSIDEELRSWDGLIQSKIANNGVYIWAAKIELVDGSIQYLTGDVTVLGR